MGRKSIRWGMRKGRESVVVIVVVAVARAGECEGYEWLGFWRGRVGKLGVWVLTDGSSCLVLGRGGVSTYLDLDRGLGKVSCDGFYLSEFRGCKNAQRGDLAFSFLFLGLELLLRAERGQGFTVAGLVMVLVGVTLP
jgi:hypothetical protein